MSELNNPFAIPTTMNQSQIDSRDKAILRKLRGAMELLQEAQTLIDGFPAAQGDGGAPVSAVSMALESNDQEDLTSIMEAIHAIGGQAYATMNTPYPDTLEGHDELTEEQWAKHFELEEQYAESWVCEGAPEATCQDCKDKHEVVMEAELIAATTTEK